MGPWPWSWSTCTGLSSSNCKVLTRGGTTLESAVCRCTLIRHQRCSTLSTIHNRSWQWTLKLSTGGLISEENQTFQMKDGPAARSAQRSCSRCLWYLAALGFSDSIPPKNVSLSKEREICRWFVVAISAYQISKTNSSFSLLQVMSKDTLLPRTDGKRCLLPRFKWWSMEHVHSETVSMCFAIKVWTVML